MILLVTGHGFIQSREGQVMCDSGIAVRRYENHENVLALQGEELEEGAGELPYLYTFCGECTKHLRIKNLMDQESTGWDCQIRTPIHKN